MISCEIVEHHVLYGSQFSYYNLEHSPPDSTIVRKKYIMDYYSLRDRLQGEDAYYERSLSHLLTKARPYTKKYNLIIVNSDRSLKSSRDPKKYFTVESVSQTMNIMFEKVNNIIKAPPAPPEDNITGSVIHINYAYSKIFYDRKYDFRKQGKYKFHGFSSVIPRLQKIYKKLQSMEHRDRTLGDIDGLYLASLSINKICKFLDKLNITRENFSVISKIMKQLFSNRALVHKVNHLVNIHSQISTTTNYKFLSHPLEIESIIRNVHGILEHRKKI